VKAYAFLGKDSTSYVTGLRWPSPGTWVERDDDAIRACGPADLAWWLDDELWEVELDGGVRDLGRALTARRARLVRRVEQWTDEVALDLVLACARQARDRGVEELHAEARDAEAAELAAASDLVAIERIGGRIATTEGAASVFAGLAADVVLYSRDARAACRAAGVAAYVAAFSLAGADKAAPDYSERFEAQRRLQAAWLRERLGL
jgi:hypothetical protein